MKKNGIEICPSPSITFRQISSKRKGGRGGGKLAKTYSFLELSSAQWRIYTRLENVSFIAVLQFATLPAQGRNNFSPASEGENGSQLCIDDGQASAEVVL